MPGIPSQRVALRQVADLRLYLVEGSPMTRIQRWGIEIFHESFLEFPSTELYQRIDQDDLGLVATDMRDVQEMVNVLISYRSDLYARPDIELPRLMALALSSSLIL